MGCHALSRLTFTVTISVGMVIIITITTTTVIFSIIQIMLSNLPKVTQLKSARGKVCNIQFLRNKLWEFLR